MWVYFSYPKETKIRRFKILLFVSKQPNISLRLKANHAPVFNAEAGLVADTLFNNSAEIGNLAVDDLCNKRKSRRVAELVFVTIDILAPDQPHQTQHYSS